MSVTQEKTTMTGPEMVALSKQHSLYEWSAQAHVDPIPVAKAKGIYFWTPEGKRFIDFNSQLMCVNIGHGDPRVIKAIQEQAATLAYANPFMATEPRARLGAKLAELTPGDIDVFFFTNGGAEANENAFKIARAVTGRQKIMARYRSYHGGTAAAIAATGDPRRWTQPAMPGVIHVLDPYHGVQRGWDTAEQSLQYLEEVIQLEGAHTIAAFILETVSGTNGILVPPDGYMQGVRALCDKYGILMIADEVMAGFGRTGAWFAINHWNVVPDIITMAKGLTNAAVPMGAVACSREIHDAIVEGAPDGIELFHGYTYSGHPLAAAAGLATLDLYKEEGLFDRASELGGYWEDALHSLKGGRNIIDLRNMGLVAAIELEPRPGAPAKRGTELFHACFDNGLLVRATGDIIALSPPLIIEESHIDRIVDTLEGVLKTLA